MPVLTIIDTTGIQNYIFGSNRLRENIGASEIVTCATSWWCFESLRQCQTRDGKRWETNLVTHGAGAEQNKRTNPFEELDEHKEIERDHLDAEVIYAGGGNTLILFGDRERAKEFTQRYTKLLLERAPGLEVVIAHSDEFPLGENDGCVIRQKRAEVMQRIGEKKVNRPLSAPLLALPVTTQCVSTGSAASFDPAKAAKSEEQEETLRDKYGNAYVSAATWAKLQYAQPANERLEQQLLSDNERWKAFRQNFDLQIPYELDNLGRSEGEASFIAVVHTDGNGMGKWVERVGQFPQTSREWVKKMRGFSREIYQANVKALGAMLDLLLAYIDLGKDERGRERLYVSGDHDEKFELSEEVRKGKRYVYLPFRPLIFGGEDVAFVCDGRLGLALTAHYLEQVERQRLTDPEAAEGSSPMYARAGVALIKTHYPFARAYTLAEDLARSAKSRISEVEQGKPARGRVSALDWHIAMTGLAGDVHEIRRREYGGNLNMRPVTLRHQQGVTRGWQSWHAFEAITTHFLTGDWQDKRNKVKALRDALRQDARQQDKKATEHFVQFYRLKTEELPRIDDYPEVGQTGWAGDTCVWFDAIEMLDLYYPLKKRAE